MGVMCTPTIGSELVGLVEIDYCYVQCYLSCSVASGYVSGVPCSSDIGLTTVARVSCAAAQLACIIDFGLVCCTTMYVGDTPCLVTLA